MLRKSKAEVTIGDVRKKVTPPKKPQYIPHKYLSMGELSQNTLKHLRWMLQKDLLKQDIFLIGQPGSTRRRLAMTFLEMSSREMEYVSLSRDTTEADLKQRREIFGGTAKYFDQSAVRAAVEGRVLILEGIEKAERNVLPVLNNLLENREMHLEDGRFLIPASRYDKLLKEHCREELDKWNLVRVSDEFRVIALGLPVPKYSGNPLDPPLRSRFQARNVTAATFQICFRWWSEFNLKPDVKIHTKCEIKERIRGKLYEFALGEATAYEPGENTSSYLSSKDPSHEVFVISNSGRKKSTKLLKS